MPPNTAATSYRAVLNHRGVIRNVYDNNVGKLVAWLSASHVEKDPKKKPATP